MCVFNVFLVTKSYNGVKTHPSHPNHMVSGWGNILLFFERKRNCIVFTMLHAYTVDKTLYENIFSSEKNNFEGKNNNLRGLKHAICGAIVFDEILNKYRPHHHT